MVNNSRNNNNNNNNNNNRLYLERVKTLNGSPKSTDDSVALKTITNIDPITNNYKINHF